MHKYTCTHTHTPPQHACEGQRTVFGRWFSVSTDGLAEGIELRSLSLCSKYLYFWAIPQNLNLLFLITYKANDFIMAFLYIKLTFLVNFSSNLWLGILLSTFKSSVFCHSLYFFIAFSPLMFPFQFPDPYVPTLIVK